MPYRAARYIALVIFIAAALLTPAGANARGHHSYRTHSYHSRTHRSREAKSAFERSTGYPHGRPGYVVDHIIPLACGGADSPSNMQWQTIAAGKAKDKVERKHCAH